MNALPIDIPRGTRYGRATQLASSRGSGGRVPMRRPVEVAQLPDPVRASVQPHTQQYAVVLPPVPPPSRSGFRIIPQAMAEPVPVHHGGSANGQWAIQVGAYSSERLANVALGSAREHAPGELSVARTSVSGVHQPRGHLYRARLTGLSREAAVQACQRLAHGRTSCMVLSPESQL